ncbi:hypothetical protein QC761_600270 [Podospora bellae-mahoneyi]|uniref:Cytochrome P450 E-class, group I n=1 Tax=Podospora bellae-mahoneyi TaxID=2093777 RepID=A0ABR0F9P4_9PEZI|nr:hypothetical protein QC761_600270 [Podospora bellae-mahoneyi]
MSHITLSLLLSLTELTLSHLFLPTFPIPPSYLLPLFLAHYLPLIIYSLFLHPFYFSPLRTLPTPGGNLPLLGQTLTLLRATSPVQTYVDWANRYPRAPFIRFLGLFHSEMVLVASPEAHKEVLMTHCYEFKKPDIMFIGDFVGRGLLFAEGGEHKIARRRLNGVFGVGSVRRVMGVLWGMAGGLGGVVEGMVGEEGEGVVDVNELYVKATIDVTGATILGVELGNLRGEEEGGDMDFLTSFRRVFQQPPLSALISFINLFLPIRRFLPMEANLGYLRASAQLRRMTLDIVKNRVKELAQPDYRNPVSNGADLLTMMLEGEMSLSKAGDKMTEDQITNELLTFIAAGHETSANALLWASYVLAVHPDIQTRLRREITSHFEAGKTPTYEQLESLVYLHNFCREILRRYCPALMTFREALKDLTICGTFIPRGTVLLLLPAVASRTAWVWGEDVDEFKPERWENLAGTEADSPYAFGAFMHGPRICIGKQFAMVEFKVLVVELVTRFEFGMTEELKGLGGREPRTTNPGMGYVPAGGMRVQFRKI